MQTRLIEDCRVMRSLSHTTRKEFEMNKRERIEALEREVLEIFQMLNRPLEYRSPLYSLLVEKIQGVKEELNNRISSLEEYLDIKYKKADFVTLSCGNLTSFQNITPNHHAEIKRCKTCKQEAQE